MHTKLIPIGIMVGLAVGAVSLAAAQEATPVGPEAASGGQPLHFDVEFDDTLVLQDEAAGFQLGDMVILSDQLLIDGEEVGHNSGVCTVTDVAGELICIVTYVLPGGTISTQLVNSPPPEKAFAITGGTGSYQNARGHGELVEAGDGTGTVTFYVTE